MKPQATYPLRLPRSLKAAVERVSRQDGASINQFIATVAEKVAGAWKPSLSLKSGDNGRIWPLTPSWPAHAANPHDPVTNDDSPD